MVSTLLFAACGLWAATADAGSITREQAQAFAREASIDMDAEAILARPAKRREVLSALLCSAQERELDIRRALENDLNRPLVRAHQLAQRDAQDASQALEVLDVDPVSCSSADVSPLVTCLSVAPPVACERDPRMRAQVRAAEILQASLGQRAKAAKP